MTADWAVLTLWSEDESGDMDWADDAGWMSSLSPLRADILSGDLRCLYLGWLNGVGCHEVEKDEVEPPVPPGLGELTAPLRALAEFLRIDDSLIEAAVEGSPPLAAKDDTAQELSAWIETLPAKDKDSLLIRLAQESPAAVQREFLRRFREAQKPQQPACLGGNRTAGQLLAAAELRTQAKRRLAAEQKAREDARRKEEAAKVRQKHLDGLAKREPQAWQEVDALIATRQPKKYDEAVQLLHGLRDLADREGKTRAAIDRTNALRAAHSGKPSLIRRLDDAKL